MTGGTFQEHLINLWKVFQRFQEACLRLNLEKYSTSGITCHLRGITTDPEKPRVVREWLTPKNKHEIGSSLALFTHYRCFICNFANIAKPLTKLTEEKQAYLWTPEVEAAYKC
jgi:hypothetical protein